MSSDTEQSNSETFWSVMTPRGWERHPCSLCRMQVWGSAINSVNYKALAHRSRKVCLLKHFESQHVFTETKKTSKKLSSDSEQSHSETFWSLITPRG